MNYQVFDIMNKVEKRPLIFRTERDSTQLEWTDNMGVYLEVEFFDDGDVGYFLEYNGITEEADITGKADLLAFINGLLQQYFKGGK